jgi:transcriptional regulator with XRE-family HTH domain
MARPSGPPNPALASRLRQLREQGFGTPITQAKLAKALGASGPSISSWETHGSVPVERLAGYARFFATPRSYLDGHPRLLSDTDLSREELDRRAQLEEELVALAGKPAGGGPASGAEAPTEGFWYFNDGNPVTIVCAQLPPDYLKRMRPFTDPNDPDYVPAYSWSDLTALIELYGYLRLCNPDSNVQIQAAGAAALETIDYANHLVLLGGVDFNPVTEDVMDRIGLDLRQTTRVTEKDLGGFVVARTHRQAKQFTPDVKVEGDTRTLKRDVALFYRGPNPWNRAVTICNGMYGRGTEGAVKASTDPQFRDKNYAYAREHSTPDGVFSLLFWVAIGTGPKVVPPDWTVADTRLYDWSVDSR